MDRADMRFLSRIVGFENEKRVGRITWFVVEDGRGHRGATRAFVETAVIGIKVAGRPAPG